MTFIAPPVSGYRSPRDQQRWLSVKNLTNETIPGFAIMYLDRDSGDEFWATEKEGEHIIYRVGKPNAVCEGLQNPALLVANSPMPILPYGHGWGTQDWPAQVIHDGGRDRAVNGSSTGPRADSWLLWSSGTAFTVQSHDGALATWPYHWKKGIHTLWITPGNNPFSSVYEGRKGGSMASSFMPFAIPSSSIQSDQKIFGLPGEAGGLTTGVDTSDTLEFLQAGVCWLAVAATLSSPDADKGDMLKITIYARAPLVSTFSPRYLSGYRLQCVEDDAYTGQAAFYTAENVAFSGPLKVARGEQLRLVNESYSPMAAGGLILSAFRLVPEQLDGGGSLVSP